MSESAAAPHLTTDEYLELFKQGTQYLAAMAASMDVCWTPDESDPRRLHNLYARNLITCYVAKFAELSASIIDALERAQYLTYALCGRSLIEHVATLRYYVLQKYKPMYDEGAWTPHKMKALIEIDDQHLRGARFDWESFLLRDYAKLKHRVADGHRLPAVVRVGKCIEKWVKDVPEIEIVYDLFCDMVHPNIGSTFLVASATPNGLYFTKNRGDSVGKHIVDQSFPLLISTTQKPFGEFLTVLMGTIWQDDELGT